MLWLTSPVSVARFSLGVLTTSDGARARQAPSESTDADDASLSDATHSHREARRRSPARRHPGSRDLLHRNHRAAAARESSVIVARSTRWPPHRPGVLRARDRLGSVEGQATSRVSAGPDAPSPGRTSSRRTAPGAQRRRFAAPEAHHPGGHHRRGAGVGGDESGVLGQGKVEPAV